jgi:hypothetical protein
MNDAAGGGGGDASGLAVEMEVAGVEKKTVGEAPPNSLESMKGWGVRSALLCLGPFDM